MTTGPLCVDPQIILPFSYALIFAEGSGLHGIPPLSRGLDDLRLARPCDDLYGQSLSSLRPPPAEDGSAAFRGHSDEEAMGSLHLCVAEIRQCLFHSLDPG